MNKYCIISTDNNPDYYSLIPLACYSWNKLGYIPMILFVNVPFSVQHKILEACPTNTKSFNRQTEPGVRDSTMAQILRLFAWQFLLYDDDILLTSDSDMIIAKDVFHCNDGFTNYGYDLTGRSEAPICYNIAKASVWKEVIGDFVLPETAYSQDWSSYWSADQQLLTRRLHHYGINRITFIDRGNQNKHGLPTGRWDRHDWSHIPDDIIDVHMKRNDWNAQIQVFERLWPGEDHSFITKFKEALDGAVR